MELPDGRWAAFEVKLGVGQVDDDGTNRSPDERPSWTAAVRPSPFLTSEELDDAQGEPGEHVLSVEVIGLA